jgi:hypothetical protein
MKNHRQLWHVPHKILLGLVKHFLSRRNAAQAGTTLLDAKR